MLRKSDGKTIGRLMYRIITSIQNLFWTVNWDQLRCGCYQQIFGLGKASTQFQPAD
jgi:hypothetical protein